VLCKVDGKITVVEAAGRCCSSGASKRGATNGRNNLGGYHIGRNIKLVVVPHRASLHPEIEIVRTPRCGAITSFREWKGATDNKHLAVIDHIARQSIVWVSSSGTLPPLDPLERRETQNVDIIETSIVCAESKASIKIYIV
jgi:hypothetical protein